MAWSRPYPPPPPGSLPLPEQGLAVPIGSLDIVWDSSGSRNTNANLPTFLPGPLDLRPSPSVPLSDL